MKKFTKLILKKLKYPIVNNVNALPETDPVKIKDLLYEQIFFRQLDGESLLLIYQKMVYLILLR